VIEKVIRATMSLTPRGARKRGLNRLIYQRTYMLAALKAAV